MTRRLGQVFPELAVKGALLRLRDRFLHGLLLDTVARCPLDMVWFGLAWFGVFLRAVVIVCAAVFSREISVFSTGSG